MLIKDLNKTLDKLNTLKFEQNELQAILRPMQADIVSRKLINCLNWLKTFSSGLQALVWLYRFLLLLLSWLLSASVPVLASEQESNQTVPLIFVPGLKGSQLRDATGESVWLTAAQALNLNTPSLALPLLWINGVQTKDAIQTEGILAQVTVIPFLLEQSLYGPWLNAASEMKRPFYAFAYDWRRDNLETLEQLESFIKEVRNRHQANKVQIVAHSMGGLLTLAAMNRHPEMLHSVIFAGVPFSGGIGFLPDLHTGTDTGLNSKILSPEVLFTFPSLYSLFPLDGSGLEDNHGKALPLDFYKLEDWKAYRLGLFSLDRPPELAQETFLDQALQSARQFRTLLQPKALEYPPILVVAGDSLPTLAKGILNGPESIRGVDFDSAAKQPGDGRVCFNHALPPKGIAYELIVSKQEHSQLLNDPDLIAIIENWLISDHD